MSERTERIYTERCKPTNAEVIRYMTDEELAEWHEYGCPEGHTWTEECEEEVDCRECWLSWLKSEAEEGEG